MASNFEESVPNNSSDVCAVVESEYSEFEEVCCVTGAVDAVEADNEIAEGGGDDDAAGNVAESHRWCS